MYVFIISYHFISYLFYIILNCQIVMNIILISKSYLNDILIIYYEYNTE